MTLPTDLDGLHIWLKGDAGVTQSSGAISNWADQSGNGYDMAQSGSPKPTVGATQNSLATVEFASASSQYLTRTNPFAGMMSASIYVLCKKRNNTPAGLSDSGLWSIGNTASVEHYPYTDGNIYGAFGRSDRPNMGTIGRSGSTFNQWHVMWHARARDYHMAGVNWQRIYQVYGYFGATETPAWATNWDLGRSVGGTAFFDGWIAEIIGFDRILSEVEHHKMLKYLIKDKWATSTPGVPTDIRVTAVQVAALYTPTATTEVGLDAVDKPNAEAFAVGRTASKGVAIKCAGGPFAYDNFNGHTAGTNIDGATATSGETWSKFGTHASPVYSDAGRVRHGADTLAAGAYLNITPISADYAAECDVVVKSLADDMYAGPIVRCVDRGGGDYDFIEWVARSGNRLGCFYAIGGSYTQLGSDVAYTYADEETMRLRIEVQGTTVRGYLNGALVFNQTSGAIPSAVGKPGFICSSGTYTGSDTTNFHVDNWQATDANYVRAVANPVTRSTTKTVATASRGQGLVFGHPTDAYGTFNNGSGMQIARDAALDDLQQFTVVAYYRDKLYGTNFANSQYCPLLNKEDFGAGTGWSAGFDSGSTLRFYWRRATTNLFYSCLYSGPNYPMPNNDDNAERVVVIAVDLSAGANAKVAFYTGPVGGTLVEYPLDVVNEGSGSYTSDAANNLVTGYHLDYGYGAVVPIQGVGIINGRLSLSQAQAMIAAPDRADWKTFTDLGLASGTTARERFGRTTTAITTYRTPTLIGGTSNYWRGPAPATANALAAGITAAAGGDNRAIGLASANAVPFAVSRTAVVSRTAGLAAATAQALAVTRTSGPVSKTIGLASATAAAFAVARTATITRSVALASATAQALAVTRTPGATSKAVGLASANAVALAVTRTVGASSRAIGLASATASAFAVARSTSAISRTIALATATAQALAVTRTATITRTVGLAAATAVGFAVSRTLSVSRTLGLATATAVGLAVTRTVGATSRTLGLATATAVGFAVTRTSGAVSRTLGLATATAVGFAVSRTTGLSRTLGLAAATAQALAVTRTIGASSRTIGLATATAVALAVTRTVGATSRTLGLATASAVAFAVTRTSSAISRTIGLASATASAFAVARTVSAMSLAAGLASATAVAFAVARTIGASSRTIGLATASAVPFAVTRTVGATAKTLGLASATAVAFAVTRSSSAISRSISLASATAVAFAVGLTENSFARAIGLAVANAVAFAVTRTVGGSTRTVGLASATAVAQPVTRTASGISRAAGLASATAVAQPVTRTLGTTTKSVGLAQANVVAFSVTRTAGGVARNIVLATATAQALPVTRIAGVSLRTILLAIANAGAFPAGITLIDPDPIIRKIRVKGRWLN